MSELEMAARERVESIGILKENEVLIFAPRLDWESHLRFIAEGPVVEIIAWIRRRQVSGG